MEDSLSSRRLQKLDKKDQDVLPKIHGNKNNLKGEDMVFKDIQNLINQIIVCTKETEVNKLIRIVKSKIESVSSEDIKKTLTNARDEALSKRKEAANLSYKIKNAVTDLKSLFEDSEKEDFKYEVNQKVKQYKLIFELPNIENDPNFKEFKELYVKLEDILNPKTERNDTRQEIKFDIKTSEERNSTTQNNLLGNINLKEKKRIYENDNINLQTKNMEAIQNKRQFTAELFSNENKPDKLNMSTIPEQINKLTNPHSMPTCHQKIREQNSHDTHIRQYPNPLLDIRTLEERKNTTSNNLFGNINLNERKKIYENENNIRQNKNVEEIQNKKPLKKGFENKIQEEDFKRTIEKEIIVKKKVAEALINENKHDELNTSTIPEQITMNHKFSTANPHSVSMYHQKPREQNTRKQEKDTTLNFQNTIENDTGKYVSLNNMKESLEEQDNQLFGLPETNDNKEKDGIQDLTKAFRNLNLKDTSETCKTGNPPEVNKTTKPTDELSKYITTVCVNESKPTADLELETISDDSDDEIDTPEEEDRKLIKIRETKTKIDKIRNELQKYDGKGNPFYFEEILMINLEKLDGIDVAKKSKIREEKRSVIKDIKSLQDLLDAKIANAQIEKFSTVVTMV